MDMSYPIVQIYGNFWLKILSQATNLFYKKQFNSRECIILVEG